MARKKKSALKKLPAPPKDISIEAQSHWSRIGEPLVTEGLLHEIDLPILELACTTWSNIGYAEDPIPLVKLYTSLMEKFGATPKARISMKVEDSKIETKSKDDKELMDAFKNR